MDDWDWVDGAGGCVDEEAVCCLRDRESCCSLSESSESLLEWRAGEAAESFDGGVFFVFLPLFESTVVTQTHTIWSELVHNLHRSQTGHSTTNRHRDPLSTPTKIIISFTEPLRLAFSLSLSTNHHSNTRNTPCHATSQLGFS